MVCGGVEAEPGTFSNANSLLKVYRSPSTPPHNHISLSGGKASDHRFGQSVSIAQIMRMVVEENSILSRLAKNLAFAGQQVMIIACSMSAFGKKPVPHPLPFVQRLMGK